MSYETFGDLDASIQEKIDTDNDFQTSLADLSDDKKDNAIKTRKSELLDEEIKSLSSGSKKDKELADNYKKRAEKAEGELRNKKPVNEPTSKPDDLSPKDTLALINAKVTEEEDIDEVVEYARFKKISVSEALKSSVVKNSLEEKAEKRKSAEAANTGPSRRGAVKPTDSEILSKASKGEIPEKGSAEALQLFWARHGGKR